MKSYCKGLVVDRGFVDEAYERWRRGDAGRKNEWRVYREHGSPSELVDEIAREMGEGTLRFPELRTRPRRDGGKVRDIGVEPVKQQVVGYVIDHALDDLMRAKLGYWQFSRPGMGQFRAAPTVKRWMNGCRYHVHGDVRKCYDSIACEVVMRVLRKYVRSGAVLRAAQAVLDSYPEGHLMIGSYLSMRLAHLVLSFGYHHVESLHKERRGKSTALVKHQCWYADDLWLFGDDKRDLKRAMRSLAKYLKDGFGLELKPWKVMRCGEDEPADIAGPVVRPSRVTIRARTFLRARRCLIRFRRRPWSSRLARRLIAYWGWLKHTDCVGFCARSGAYAAVAAAKRLISNQERARAKCLSSPSTATRCRPA